MRASWQLGLACGLRKGGGADFSVATRAHVSHFLRYASGMGPHVHPNTRKSRVSGTPVS